MMLETMVSTTAAKAEPTTTATASSMTLPRMMKSLKPLSMASPLDACAGRAVRTWW